jgi:lactoylglutathione lyase
MKGLRLRVARRKGVCARTLERRFCATDQLKRFGASIGPKYANSSKGFESRFLTFQDGARLELMKTALLRPMERDSGANRMGLTHLAFSLGSENRVDELTATLREAGFGVKEGPRRTGDGYYESVVIDPDGNRLELTV